jgi:hypothetical protein
MWKISPGCLAILLAPLAVALAIALLVDRFDDRPVAARIDMTRTSTIP